MSPFYFSSDTVLDRSNFEMPNPARSAKKSRNPHNNDDDEVSSESVSVGANVMEAVQEIAHAEQHNRDMITDLNQRLDEQGTAMSNNHTALSGQIDNIQVLLMQLMPTRAAQDPRVRDVEQEDNSTLPSTARPSPPSAPVQDSMMNLVENLQQQVASLQADRQRRDFRDDLAAVAPMWGKMCMLFEECEKSLHCCDALNDKETKECITIIFQHLREVFAFMTKYGFDAVPLYTGLAQKDHFQHDDDHYSKAALTEAKLRGIPVAPAMPPAPKFAPAAKSRGKSPLSAEQKKDAKVKGRDRRERLTYEQRVYLTEWRRSNGCMGEFCWYCGEDSHRSPDCKHFGKQEKANSTHNSTQE